MTGDRTTALALAALLVTTSAIGCVRSETYRPHAFVPIARHYRVRYLRSEESDARVLPEGWTVRGYRLDDRGRPTAPIARPGALERVAIDVDEDSRPDVRGEVPRYDLRYEHDEDGAEIWASTIPMPPRLARRSIGILARNLIDGVYGQGFVAWDRSRSEVRAREYETTILDEQEVLVGGAPGYLVTFEIAQVVSGRRASIGETCTIVLVRPGRLGWSPDGRAREGGLPMLVLVGYASRSDRYAIHRPELDAFLDRLDVRPDAL